MTSPAAIPNAAITAPSRSTCIDPKTQIVEGKTVCVVSCQRSPEPVFLRWNGLEAVPEGDFFVRSGPGTVKLSPEARGSTYGRDSRTEATGVH
jgi:hypothetical protein